MTGSTVAGFAMLYFTIGGGCVLALLVHAGPTRHGQDAVLLLALWPLYGPFLLGRPAAAGASTPKTDFLGAIQRAGDTSLAALLPSAETAAGLQARVGAAEQRVAEIDALLTQPDFDEEAAEARSRALEAEGEPLAASIAASRARNIRQLKQLRDRFRRELAEIRELLAQLRLQAELVRFAGAADGGSREVVQMLLARVEGLGAILDQESTGAVAKSD